jgi:hypothetical protein
MEFQFGEQLVGNREGDAGKVHGRPSPVFNRPGIIVGREQFCRETDSLLVENCGIELVTLPTRVLNDHLSCTDGIGWGRYL